MNRYVGSVIVALVCTSAWWVRPVAAQNCDDVNALLRNGNSVDQVMQITGLTFGQIRACSGSREQHLVSPVGPAPLGAAGPAPHGAAGPAPAGAAGPPPRGAAGPAPFGTR
ncbi:MAG TPA: hypothetical protein VL403_10605 [Candidatus Kryptonia bacterium]|nr:hypothetical protein [Candidatus Kryptonia bacterium]